MSDYLTCYFFQISADEMNQDRVAELFSRKQEEERKKAVALRQQDKRFS